MDSLRPFLVLFSSKKSRKAFLFSVTAYVLLSVSPAHAWEATGHRVVGELAQRRLSSATLRAVRDLVPDADLAEMSTWADLIRFDPEWKVADPWHFINVEEGESWETRKRSPKGDIVEAIPRFMKDLIDTKLSKEKRAQALKFIVHFVGDIHQPLHAGRFADLGGNTISVKWFSETTNLHRVWDAHVIEYEKLSYREKASFLTLPDAVTLGKWESDSVDTWAQESFVLRNEAYATEKGAELNAGLYHFQHHATINRRLMQAGVRLAALLNQAFASRKALQH